MSTDPIAVAVELLFDLCLFPRRLRPAVEERARRAAQAVFSVERARLNEARVSTIVMNVALQAERDAKAGLLERVVP